MKIATKKLLSRKYVTAIWIYVISCNQKFISSFPTIITRTPAFTNGDKPLRSLRNNCRKNSLSRLLALQDSWQSFETISTTKASEKQTVSPGAKFLIAINDKDIDKAMTFVVDTEREKDTLEFEFEDTDFQNPWKSPKKLERELRLRSEVFDSPNLVIDDDFYDAKTGKSGVAFHLESCAVEQKGAAFFQLSDKGLIKEAFVVRENDKSGELSLKVLKLAADIIGATKDKQNNSRFVSSQSSTLVASKPLSTLTKHLCKSHALIIFFYRG